MYVKFLVESGGVVAPSRPTPPGSALCTDNGIGNTNNQKYEISWDNITREGHMSELKTLEETFALIKPRRNEWQIILLDLEASNGKIDPKIKIYVRRRVESDWLE